ncbi:hypothetical protein BGZ95_010716 [Linnemannia exigua]|uniref:WD40 repeat-like protein n=1 Tax=Linnemannia exigua TaxID=604196 RepID=A0AAD4H6Y7_9FUNG|nr:hypothetical protein BGZ95_010716 [Linnemannia exigua]
MDEAHVLSPDGQGLACIFPKNVAKPVIKTNLPAPQQRIEWTPQLAYSIRLIRDSRLSLLPTVAADGLTNRPTIGSYRTDAVGSVGLVTSEEQSPALDESECEWVRVIEQEHDQQERFQWLADRVVDEFITSAIKDSVAVAEVVVLGPVLDRATYRRLLSCFLVTFDQDCILNVTLLKGLVILIESASPRYILDDDLIRALDVLGQRLMVTHMMASESTYQLTSMICRLLDVAVIGGIKGFSRNRDHRSLVAVLDGLLNIADPILQFQGSYALQALRYNTDYEPILQTVLRFAGGMTKAELEWYLVLLAARMFVRDGRLADFNRAVCEAHCRDELFFQLGVCQILGEIAMDPAWDNLTRQLTVDFLSTLYKGKLGWQQHKSVVQWLFAIITQASELLEPAVRDHALVVLKDLGLENTPAPAVFTYSLKSRPPLPDVSPLLARVQNIPQLEYDLQALKKQRLDEGDMSVYIPPMAKANLQAPDDHGLFSLMDKVQDFLTSSSKVMLILGDSGSGKSTYNRYLERRLWIDHKYGYPIPLFINLPAIDRPDLDMIGKQLRAHGFSDDKIQELKEHHRLILICDGYDESQLTANLHTTNQLNLPGEWDAKLIITCRAQHLGANYRDHFVPKLAERYHPLADDLFQEAVIAPFSKDQIENYVDQYVLESRTWTKQAYMDKLTAIPNIMDLVRTPFLLSLVLETLPSVVHNTRDPSRVRVSRAQLYDVFVKKWLRGSEKRLTQNVRLHNSSRRALDELLGDGFEQLGNRYQIDLARAIFLQQGGKLVVDYTHRQDKFSWKRTFFGPEPTTTLLRDASLLKRSGSQHRFIHRSLLEYFFSRSVTDPIEEVDESRPQDRFNATDTPLSFAGHPLSWRDLTNEPSIIQFLCDRVQQSPAFKQQLLSIVEQSKTNPEASQAAANAVTILFKSGVRLNSVDLRRTRIPGADLSGGELDSAQLQGADLTGVNFSRSWLRQADFSRATMSGVKFGEWPFLEMDREPAVCAYSTDGESLAVGLSDGTILIYDTSTWTTTLTLSGHTKAVTSLVFSPHERHRLFSASRDEKWGDWDLNTGKPELVPGGHGGVLTSITVSSDGQQLATGGSDNMVRLWSSDTLQQVDVLQGHSEMVTCLAFSPNGSKLASGGNDNAVRLWNIMSGDAERIIQSHSESISSVAFAPNGQYIVSGSHDATVRVWSVSTGESLAILSNHTDRVSAVTHSPDGQYIVSASWDRTVRVWNSVTHAQVSALRGATKAITSLSVSPTGLQQIAACSNDKTVRLWDASPSLSDAFSSGDLWSVAESTGHIAGISTMAISADGQQLATGG